MHASHERSGGYGPWGLVLAAAVALGCDGDEATSRLRITKQPDDSVERRADWSYTSFEVDISLTLITRVSADACRTSGALTVDEALSEKTHYTLPATDCAELELSERGDIVIAGDVTGHDWSTEDLSVDTESEVISLGPTTLPNAEGVAVEYRFTLSAPDCPEEPDCQCGVLRRLAGSVALDFSLGRRC